VDKEIDTELNTIIEMDVASCLNPLTSKRHDIPMAEVLFLLPNGVRCNNELFNPDVTSRDAQTLIPTILYATDLPSKPEFLGLLSPDAQYNEAALSMQSVFVLFKMAL